MKALEFLVVICITALFVWTFIRFIAMIPDRNFGMEQKLAFITDLETECEMADKSPKFIQEKRITASEKESRLKVSKLPSYVTRTSRPSSSTLFYNFLHTCKH